MESKALSPEIVSFLLALRAVKQTLGEECFGQYEDVTWWERCVSERYNISVCIICKKVCTEYGIEWIDALLKAYPGRGSE